MKTALTYALFLVGGVSLLAGRPAWGQYGQPYYPPASTADYSSSAAQQEPHLAPPRNAATRAPTRGATNGRFVSNGAANGPAKGAPAATSGGTARSGFTPNGAEIIPAPTPPANGAASPDSLSPAAYNLMVDNGLCGGGPLSEGCSICGGGYCAPPDWYVIEGVRFFGRTKPREVSLGFNEVFGTIETNPVQPQQFIIHPQVLNTRTSGPNFTAADTTTFGHWFARDVLDRDHFFEFTYWGQAGFHDETTIHALTREVLLLNQQNEQRTNLRIVTGSLVTPFYFDENTGSLTGNFVNGFDGADVYHTFYSSYTHNFELNGRFSPRGQQDQLVLHPDGKWRKECRPGRYISYLYGLRFMMIDETFRWHSEGTTQTFDATTGTLLDTQTFTGDYDVVSHNNLLGLQFGADLTFRQCRWSWGLAAKVGPYVNFADQTTDLSAGTPLAPELAVHQAVARHNASLVGEFKFQATYKFRPNIEGRASYDFLWITGLALAPEQVQTLREPVDRVNTNGTIFFHGPSLALEYMW